MGGVGWWVSTWMVQCVPLLCGCSTCFVLSFSGPIMVVSPLSLDLYYCGIRLLLYCCCNTWVGGSLRGRHCCTTFCCTAVSRWVDRFVAETMLPLCCYILRSITINSGTLKNDASAWPVLLEKTEKQLEQQQQQQQPSGEGCCFSYSYT